MAFLSRLRKDDLKYIVYELGEDIPEVGRIVDLKNCTNSSSYRPRYDEGFIHGLLAGLNAERAATERKAAAEREALLQHELAMKKLKVEAQILLNNNSSCKPKVEWQAQLRNFDPRIDDIGLFLVHFERVMKRVYMESSLWAACLTGVLPCEIVQLIMREPDELAENYSYVKELLLKRFRLSVEKFRQLFL